MAKLVVLQPTKQPPISLLSSSLSHFNGTKLCQIRVDRQDFEFVKSSLSAEGYDVVYDINGTRLVLMLLASNSQYRFICLKPVSKRCRYHTLHDCILFCCINLKSDILPHCEVDAVHPKSRHKGKLNTESLLETSGVNWTSLRPVYIYGPLNYNPVEEWFFHHLKAGRPIPIPNSGVQITQLGHVKVSGTTTLLHMLDLATAFVQVLGNEKASKQMFNISGEKYVTFNGLAKAYANAGGFPEPEIIHYNPKEFDFGKKKAFPFRDQHFFASVEKAKHVLGWKPEFDLVEGLTDSYNLDFGRGTYRKEADFSTDDMILNNSFALQS
ncbi:hypothetical protein GQ457_02G037010 [Hibiscus cannabinus]